jgi:hypothetical protein
MSKSAAIGLICSLFGCVPFVPSLAGIVLGIIGYQRTEPSHVSGRGFAVSAIGIGCIGIAIWSVLAFTTYQTIRDSRPARIAAEQHLMSSPHDQLPSDLTKDDITIDTIGHSTTVWSLAGFVTTDTGRIRFRMTLYANADGNYVVDSLELGDS